MARRAGRWSGEVRITVKVRLMMGGAKPTVLIVPDSSRVAATRVQVSVRTT